MFIEIGAAAFPLVGTLPVLPVFPMCGGWARKKKLPSRVPIAYFC
jgi:hypothetical protein